MIGGTNTKATDNYKVYKHTFPNGKIYIGITSQQGERRWRADGSGYSKCPLMQRAINKYGWENVKHEILFDGLTKENAELKEIELISQFKSNNKIYGYNIENGGHTNKISEQQKERLRIVNKGKHHSEETKQKISQSNKGKHTISAEQFERMCKARHYEKVWNKGKTIDSGKHIKQYDKEGNFIKEWCNVNQAEKELHTSHIYGCISGKRKTAGGFVWELA